MLANWLSFKAEFNFSSTQCKTSVYVVYSNEKHLKSEHFLINTVTFDYWRATTDHFIILLVCLQWKITYNKLRSPPDPQVWHWINQLLCILTNNNLLLWKTKLNHLLLRTHQNLQSGPVDHQHQDIPEAPVDDQSKYSQLCYRGRSDSLHRHVWMLQWWLTRSPGVPAGPRSPWIPCGEQEGGHRSHNHIKNPCFIANVNHYNYMRVNFDEWTSFKELHWSCMLVH